MKLCPYCGKRIRYNDLFSVKNKGSYECQRCKKESKVKIDKKMILLFIAVCLLAVLITIIWCVSGLSNNLIGVVIVALLLFAFYLTTPFFLEFVPISKHKNDIGKRKNYEEKSYTETTESDFVFNREAFDKVKRKRELGIMNMQESDISSSSESIKRENMVPVIEDVKEGHASSSDGPLHKIKRSPKPSYDHKYQEVIEEIEFEEEVKQYVPKKKKKPEGSKYTANRRL